MRRIGIHNRMTAAMEGGPFSRSPSASQSRPNSDDDGGDDDDDGYNDDDDTVTLSQTFIKSMTAQCVTEFH